MTVRLINPVLMNKLNVKRFSDDLDFTLDAHVLVR